MGEPSPLLCTLCVWPLGRFTCRSRILNCSCRCASCASPLFGAFCAMCCILDLAVHLCHASWPCLRSPLPAVCAPRPPSTCQAAQRRCTGPHAPAVTHDGAHHARRVFLPARQAAQVGWATAAARGVCSWFLCLLVRKGWACPCGSHACRYPSHPCLPNHQDCMCCLMASPFFPPSFAASQRRSEGPDLPHPRAGSE